MVCMGWMPIIPVTLTGKCTVQERACLIPAFEIIFNSPAMLYLTKWARLEILGTSWRDAGQINHAGYRTRGRLGPPKGHVAYR